MSDHQKQGKPQPPEPPKINSKFKLYPYQYIGVPIIFLVPLLALFGVFGHRLNATEASSADLRMEIDYASPIRYKVWNAVNVHITNESDELIPVLRVEFDQPFVDAFTEVSFTPDVNAVTHEHYIVELTDVEPGETRVVSMDMRGEAHFSHTGAITVSADGIDPVSESISIFVWP